MKLIIIFVPERKRILVKSFLTCEKKIQSAMDNNDADDEVSSKYINRWTQCVFLGKGA
jgi:hypothetical protein